MFMFPVPLSIELGRSKSAKAPAAVGELAPAGFLKEVCDKLNLVPVVVISPSLSGMYSLPFLLEYQALVRAYIPIAPICTEKFTVEQYQSVKVCVCFSSFTVSQLFYLFFFLFFCLFHQSFQGFCNVTISGVAGKCVHLKWKHAHIFWVFKAALYLKLHTHWARVGRSRTRWAVVFGRAFSIWCSYCRDCCYSILMHILTAVRGLVWNVKAMQVSWILL